MKLLGESSQIDLANRIAVWRAQMSARAAAGEALSADLQAAIAAAEAANEVYETALGDLKAAQGALDAAKQKLEQAQRRLDALSPEDPGYGEALAEYRAAQKGYGDAEVRAKSAEKAAFDAHTDAKGKVAKVDHLLSEASEFVVAGRSLQQVEERHLSSAAKLTMLMAAFTQMVNKNSEQAMRSDMALFETMQKGRQKEMERKSDEYQKEVREAEESARNGSCAGTAIGLVVSIASVLLAAPTGGASLALAAVGLALTVADEITKAVSGFSFMEAGMAAVADVVLKPIMQMFGDDLAGKIIGAIVAAVVMAVVVVAVALIGKQLLAKVAEKLAPVVMKLVQKVAPEVLKKLASASGEMIKSGFQAVGKRLSLNMTQTNMQLVRNKAGYMLVGGELAESGARSAGSILSGIHQRKAGLALADFMSARGSLEQIEQWLKETVRAFGHTQATVQNMMVVMSDALQREAETSRFVLRGIAHA